MRIGPKMNALKVIVERYPGRHGNFYAAWIGPHKSLQYGYRTIHRAVKAGIVKRVQGERKGWFKRSQGPLEPVAHTQCTGADNENRQKKANVTFAGFCRGGSRHLQGVA